MSYRRLKVVSLKMEEGLLQEVDRMAMAMGTTRSALIRKALWSYIESLKALEERGEPRRIRILD